MKIVTWQEINERLKDIDSASNRVYGIPKGGMILTAFLSNAQVIQEPLDADLIIDDIVDSSKTKEHYNFYYPYTRFWACFNKQTENISDWVVFPWEEQHPSGMDSIEDNIVRQLQYIGDDPNRSGLQDTPRRIVKMWDEVFRGYNLDQKPKVSVFKNGTDGITYDQMIIDTGDFYSHCEHHMVPFFGQYWFGYIPDKNGNIIGLSKVARLVDYHAARLQVQERLVNDVVEDIWQALNKDATRPVGMGLIMEGEHLCKTMRGAKKRGKMITTALKGAFLEDSTIKQEFFNTIE